MIHFGGRPRRGADCLRTLGNGHLLKKFCKLSNSRDGMDGFSVFFPSCALSCSLHIVGPDLVDGIMLASRRIGVKGVFNSPHSLRIHISVP